jgi:uncharacterized membrane protein
MIDLHPVLSGLPFASAVLLLTAELMVCIPRTRVTGETLRRCAVIACPVATVAAFLSGYQASSLAGEVAKPIESVIGTHHALGRFLLIDALLLAAFFFLATKALHGKGVMRTLYYGTALGYIVLTLIVGNLGGSLVFEHGVNVRLIQR